MTCCLPTRSSFPVVNESRYAHASPLRFAARTFASQLAALGKTPGPRFIPPTQCQSRRPPLSSADARSLLIAHRSLLYSPTKVVENATMRLSLSYNSTARRAF